MAQRMRACKICGKEYPYCKTPNPSNMFRYQDVACCPEHGAQYLEEILRSRGELPEETKPESIPEPEIEETEELEDEDEFEDEDEDEFEDDEFDEDEEDDID